MILQSQTVGAILCWGAEARQALARVDTGLAVRALRVAAAVSVVGQTRVDSCIMMKLHDDEAENCTIERPPITRSKHFDNADD